MDVINLLIALALAALAPIVVDLLPRIVVPVAVIEVLLGLLAGPQLLGVLHVDALVSGFSQFGLAFLFFLAGIEVDLGRIRGAPLRAATLGWFISLGAAISVAMLLVWGGMDAAPSYLALALATTALGTLLPVLGDAGQSDTSLGRIVMACGAVGEFLPIVAIALVLNPGERSFIDLDMFVLVVLVGVFAARRWKPARLVKLIRATMHSSGQLAVRLSVVLLLALVGLASAFGLDILLGAFAAGVIVNQVIGTADSPDAEHLRHLQVKYEGIGYGMVIPIFFVTTGASFDLASLLAQPLSLLLLVGFAGLFVVLRGLPSALLARRAGLVERRVPLMLLTATALPLVVTITSEAVDADRMSSAVASALVGAAMVSVLLFPAVALALVARSDSRRVPDSR